MQLHIKRQGEHYSPVHQAKPLPELTSEAEDACVAGDDLPNWKTSRYVPLLLVLAVVVLGGVIFFAREFQSGESLEHVRVEGNRQLLTSEVLSLAAIDRNQKFYDIDLRSIEQRVGQHGIVRHVSISREAHPNTITIHIDERLPLAMIKSSSGEPMLVDNDLKFFMPKKLSGLADPNKLLAVPVLDGVNEKDTALIIEMSRIVREIETTGDSSLREVIGELKRTPTGAYVIYTAYSMTPIFIGSPRDVRFTTTLERETDPALNKAENERLFDHQLNLLAALWKQKLRTELWSHNTLYVDARFNGQVIVRHRGTSRSPSGVISAKIDSTASVASIDTAHRQPQQLYSTTSPTTRRQ
ncbi:MAG TPA: FtsQ-type POTRA domain-containing protein [Candidatus Kapabacteria bacterium]|nr:FtsQ-type POTRA domain-containing protein [Candidatus Kapabacteria bacterium]